MTARRHAFWLALTATLLAAVGWVRVLGAEAYVTVASESVGVPHVACFLEYGNGNSKWLGFGPRDKDAPLGNGYVDHRSIEREIEHYARFRVDSEVLREAEQNVIQRYQGRKYVAGVCDCVSFAADLARACGLDVPSRPNFVPENLVRRLAARNQDRLLQCDVLPYPWLSCRSARGETVRIRLSLVCCEKTETVAGPDRIIVRAFAAGKDPVRLGPQELNDGEHWKVDTVLFTLRRGEAVGIQLWDDDRNGPDDLVLQWCFCADELGRRCEEQTRGTRANGSESIYRIEVSVEH